MSSKDAATYLAFLLSNSMIEASESDDRTPMAESDWHAFTGSWDLDMIDEIELMRSTFS